MPKKREREQTGHARWQDVDDPLENLPKGNPALYRKDTTQQFMVFEQRGHEEQEQSKKQFLSACLRGILQEVDKSRTLVIVKDRAYATDLALTYSRDGFPCTAVHGQISQIQRQFRGGEIADGTLRLMVCTEGVASWLATISPGVTHLIHFDWCPIDEYAARLKLLGQGATSLMLFQYDENFPFLPDTYVRFLEKAQQAIPPDLQSVANEVSTGRRTIAAAFFKKKKSKQWDAWTSEASKKPCWYLINRGVCGKGEKCPYNHAVTPLSGDNPNPFAALQGFLGQGFVPGMPAMMFGLQPAAASSSAIPPASSQPVASSSSPIAGPFLKW